MSASLFSNINAVAEVNKVDGNVQIKPAQMNIVPGSAIEGRLLYDGDILHSNQDSKIQFSLIESNIQITMFGLSELRIDCNKPVCVLKLNYGKIFTETSNSKQLNSSIITNTLEVILDKNELWVTRSIAGKDDIFAIEGSATIIPARGVEKHIKMGEMLIFNTKDEAQTIKIQKDLIPAHIFHRLEKNLTRKTKEIPFTVMNYFTDDSSIAMAFHKEEKKISPFHITLEAGAVTIEESQYIKAFLLPMYTSEQLNIGYDISRFIGLSDSSKNFNSFATLSQILTPLTFDYQSSKGNFHLKLGRFSNLTFGYGMLLKRYTNTISYPIKQDGGLVFEFKSDAENYTYQLFTSSIEELTSGGGITGMYGTVVMSLMKSLRMGAGIIYDMNQFSAVSESMWSGVSPRKRSISGYQIDFTYELQSNLLNDTYLFGEFTALSYAKNLHYIRTEEVDWESSTTEQGFGRKSSFGILAPGIHWKIGHHRDIKIAFTYSSSLHMSPFFGETYNLERVHYVPSSIIKHIDTTYAYNLIEEWNRMIKENHIDKDSSAYYLPKDVYVLLNPTYNVNNKIGFSTEYSYKYRNYYEYSFDISVLQETGVVESNTTYYTLGMNFFINDGLIQRISEFGLYFNQYFTSELFKTSNYNENMVFGARLEIKLLQFMSLRMYRHNVFYDRDLDGNVDINSTMGIGFVLNF